MSRDILKSAHSMFKKRERRRAKRYHKKAASPKGPTLRLIHTAILDQVVKLKEVRPFSPADADVFYLRRGILKKSKNRVRNTLALNVVKVNKVAV